MSDATLKTYRIGLWALKKELATCTDPKRRAVIERQLPEYVQMIARLSADPRDDFTSAEHADEAADLGNADDVMGAI